MIKSFYPPLRTLMGPGPSDVHPRVLEALARPTVGHLDPAFQQLMEEIKLGLRYAFKTENSLTYPVSAPGSAGMETCFANLVAPGTEVVVCRNGAFGGRMQENVVRAGGKAIMVDFEWGTAIDPNQVEDALKANPNASVLAFVHAETSTGVKADAATLADLARKYDCLTIMDCVTSLGGSELELDKWGIDAAYSGSQKCLSAPPGLSPVSFSSRAAEFVKSRETKVQSWFLDLSLVMDYWDGTGGRTYHHTAPVNALYGLHEALVILSEEGIDNAWARHEKMHTALVAGLGAMGLEMLVNPEDRLNQLNTVKVPDGVDEAAVRTHALKHFNLEIGAGLGSLAGKVWRIGLMGHAAKRENITLCMAALSSALAEQQVKVDLNASYDAVMQKLQ
ncbi:alanine--glyoxylate aminotransferase family protein [Kordiimonas sp. SCSIO 12610]|uniref:pyridoxal-phosphate-dependent aminotransferase family protein n=1 Tax=Kordiimonas sp. SCSIO 12610 TaxID=2829597 RepID=UPI002108F246|nr:alanine--glyoxylate aminotransferase family protein [Kordiimonas sp. SCSIO 12610]